MMKRGQAGLEYIYLVGIVIAAIVATLVYMNRGFQGNIRQKADEIGSGQYEPGNTTANNTETKHVVSKIESKSVDKIKYGGRGEEGTQLQEELSENIKEQRKIERKLAELNDEWQNATLAEALSHANDYYPIKLITDLANSIANAVKALFDPDANKPTASSNDWSTVENQISANKTQTATLKLQLAEAKEKAAKDSGYQEQVDMIESQLKAKAKELVELQATLDLMILNADKDDLSDTYKSRRNSLVPNEDTDPDAVQDKIDEITKGQEDRQKADEAALEAAAGPSSGDYTPDSSAGTSLEAVYEAIKGIKPPPASVIEGTPRSLSVVNLEIAQNQAQLAQLALEYTQLLNQYDDLPVNPDETLSSENVNTETGTVTINKTTNETLGNL
ncbi:MAG: hypothetical protein PHO40_06205 [Candidatus Omnitrophica bacterium]|jgi:hypothetical protein|nr:hypothetical protein [Candidatus Omnitrophota bacterium]